MNNSVSSPNSTVAPSTTTDSASQSGQAGTGPGIKLGQEIHATMSALTGVPMTQKNVMGAFKTLRSQLPLTTDISSFQASHQIAILKLATEYCDAAIENTQIFQSLLPGFTLGDTLGSTFPSDAIKVQFIAVLIQKFWGTGLATRPSDSDIQATLKPLLEDLLTGAPNTQAGAKSVIKGVCTAALASSPVVLL